MRESGADRVFRQQSDTSTGVVADVRAIKEEVGEALLVVDAISSLGAVALETDAWGIDVVVSGSQKALMCPPGLATVSVPERVLARATSPRTFYFDWHLNREGAGCARRGVHAGGVARAQASTSRSACFSTGVSRPPSSATSASGARARAGVKAMGLELFSPDDDSAAVVTAVRCPDGIDGRRAAPPSS